MEVSGAQSEPAAPGPLVNRLGAAAYAIAAFAIGLDQAVKYWLTYVYDLPGRGSVPVLGPLHLTFVLNRGVSFGLLQADMDLMRWALTAFSLAVAAALIWWARKPDRWTLAVGLGLIIGGALGNAVDRFRLGAVIDFFDVQRLGFFPWIFNVGDSAITVGVALLLLDSVRKDRTA